MSSKPSVSSKGLWAGPSRTIRSWLEARSSRERVLILGLALLVCMSGVWYGAVSPLLAVRDAAHARLQSAREASIRLEASPAGAQARILTRLQGPLGEVMVTRAATLDLLLTEVTSGGSDGSVDAVIVSEPYDAVMTFVAALERVDGVQIQSLDMASSGEPGRVNLQISVRRP